MVKFMSELQAPTASCISPASCASIFQPVSVEIKLCKAMQLQRPLSHPTGSLQGFLSFYSYLQPKQLVSHFYYKHTQNQNTFFPSSFI